MPNTFNADGRPDLMSNQDQYAYLKATGDTISGRKQEATDEKPTGFIDPEKAATQRRMDDASDEARRNMKKIRQTSFGLPMTPK